MSEEMIVRNCSPTLAGLKTANLFSCPYRTVEELRRQIKALNRRLDGKGLRIIPLRISNGKALIYVYRPSKLKKDFSNTDTARLLEGFGYDMGACPEICVGKLARILQAGEESSSAFPHEIGLFLGYPPEDVQGFISKGGSACKLSGCWKVYGDEDAARRTFASYKKCTELYVRLHSGGQSLENLAVKS